MTKARARLIAAQQFRRANPIPDRHGSIGRQSIRKDAHVKLNKDRTSAWVQLWMWVDDSQYRKKW